MTCERFGRDFAAVTALALDHRPLPESQRILITVVARAQNQGITWNEQRTSVGANWGKGPPIVERVPATIALAATGDRLIYALAPDGSRARPIEVQRTDSGITFSIGPNDRTIHYEIVAR